MRKILIHILLSVAISVYAQDEQPYISDEDNNKTIQLEELIVKGENAWFEGDKAVFLPSKSAKNLSSTMEDLIGRMNTGILIRDERGEIRTIGGQSVNIFINGVPADGLDKSTFWAKNALRIEFMESSNDPKFQGKTNILNFIMKDYIAGGLTKFYGNQTLPNMGNYNLSSKLVWGKMTYQALVNGGYSRDHISGSERVENYNNVWYNSHYYDNISRSETTDNYLRNNDMYSSFTARYRGNKFMSTHGIGLQWNEDPGSGLNGLTEYNPYIITGNIVKRHKSGRSLSPSVWGSYDMLNNTKWYVGGMWTFVHSHNDGFSIYREGDANEILTNTKENSYRGQIDILTNYQIRNNMFLSFSFTERIQNYNTEYSGSTLSCQKQSESSSEILANVWYRPFSKLTFSIIPEIKIYNRKVNHKYKSSEKIPGLNATVYYSINNRSYLSLKCWYAQQVAPAPERNDLILRQTELKWIEGNPSGKNSDFYSLTINYGITPNSWFNTSVNLGYSINNNEFATIYRSGNIDYDGVIGQYSNAKRFESYNCNWHINFKLFDGKLNLYNQLQYFHQYITDSEISVNWRVRPSLMYNFGNCSIGMTYSSPEQYLSNGGNTKIKTHNQYGINFTYGNGHLIFMFKLDNIFNKRLTTHELFASGPYSYESRNWSQGRSVGFSLSYTFDYGKKVDPSIDISTKQLKTTSVLGSE